MKDLALLVRLSDARYRRQQQGIKRLMREEARLRESLRQLDTQLAESHACLDLSQQALGADLLWQGWVGRKKAALNQQLARLLVIKEQHLKQLRLAYGKLLVSEKLEAEERAARLERQRRAALAQATEGAAVARASKDQ